MEEYTRVPARKQPVFSLFNEKMNENGNYLLQFFVFFANEAIRQSRFWSLSASPVSSSARRM